MKIRRWSVLFCLAVLAATVFMSFGGAQTIRDRIRARRAGKSPNSGRHDTQAPNQPVTCADRPNLGFKVLRFPSGLRAAAWYPALAAEREFTYANGLSSALAENAPVAGCGEYPVAVFSHGFGGCSTQSVFFTEQLARQGFVVIAPDHKDARCKVDEPRHGFSFERAEEPFRRPEKWSDRTYDDRRDDVREILNQLRKMPEFARAADTSRVAGVGHSLGGYTMMALGGAWRSWKDQRIKAILLFSPYAPFLEHGTVRDIDIPVMYQGGERDWGITPGLKKAGGVYDTTKSPKYFVEFRQQGHLDWTIRSCGSGSSVDGCTAGNPNVKAVVDNGIAFLITYMSTPVVNRTSLDLKSGPLDRSVVASYRFQP